MLEPSRLPAVALLFALVGGAFASTAPEDFVKDKKAPAEAGKAPAENGGAAAAPAAKPAKASKGGRAAQPAPMDTVKIHEQYLEGDFDQAIRSLESQLKSQRPMSHAESVFVYKHLGVMYAAQQVTRERGKHYMQALIAIEPTAKILDMYASDMIHLIFRNVQEEFEAKRLRLAPPRETTAVASAQEPAPERSPPPQPAASGPSKGSARRKTVFLAAAGASVAVGALALFFILGDEEPKTRTIEVSE